MIFAKGLAYLSLVKRESHFKLHWHQSLNSSSSLFLASIYDLWREGNTYSDPNINSTFLFKNCPKYSFCQFIHISHLWKTKISFWLEFYLPKWCKFHLILLQDDILYLGHCTTLLSWICFLKCPTYFTFFELAQKCIQNFSDYSYSFKTHFCEK